jgi:hypothetical protein
MLVTLTHRNFFIAFYGFAALFLNVFFWLLIFFNGSLNKKTIEVFSKVIIVFAIINSILAIYQYFIDATIFGFLSGIYADENLINSGILTRRTTGLLGGPQNLSLLLGSSLFITSMFSSNKIRIFSLMIIIIAGFTTGARIFGISFLLWVASLSFTYIKGKKSFSLFFQLFVLLGAITIISQSFFIINRSFDISNWAAINIYSDLLSRINGFTLLFGNGLGYENWITGSQFTFDYSNTESSYLSIFYQLGISSLIYIFIYIRSIYYAFGIKNYLLMIFILVIFINFLFTPSTSGFAMSFILTPYIMFYYSNSLKTKKINKRTEQ